MSLTHRLTRLESAVPASRPAGRGIAEGIKAALANDATREALCDVSDADAARHEARRRGDAPAVAEAEAAMARCYQILGWSTGP